MPLFKRKVKITEAHQLTEDNIEFVTDWSKGQIKGIILPKSDWVIDLQTPSGEQRAEIGDYIINGGPGDFYPCKPDKFIELYEAI